jgi:hypothetical protein
MIDAGFSTLIEFKSRLTIIDDVDNTLIRELLRNVSVAMGAYIGRELRRDYGLREVFGGQRVARLSRWPIIKVHSIRESPTRDFTDSANYTELVEGVDWELEPSPRRRPGELGFVRRINGRFLGSEQSQGQTEVVYSAGWKTDDEKALENASVTISSAGRIQDLAVIELDNSPTNAVMHQLANLDDDVDIGGALSSPAPTLRRGIMRFNVGDRVMPTWQIIEATLNFKYKLASGSAPSVNIRAMLLDPQPLFADASALWTAEKVTPIIDTRSYSSASFLAVAVALHSIYPTYDQNAAMARINETASRGFIAFGWDRATETAADLSVLLNSVEATNSDDRPTLVLNHRNTLVDIYGVPRDLQEACLLQSIDHYQTRKRPGHKAEVMRGIGVASGVSYLKDPSSLLPMVKSILANYES